VLIPTFPTHALAPLQMMFWFVAWKFCPYVDDQSYESVPQGLPFQQPLDVCDASVLNAWRVPLGTQPFTHVPLLQ
jgi:hypothetical protein